jgi:nicotinamide phosphoribosyltransferase
MGLEESERETYRRIITEVYPTGPVSVVSDTWDYWNVLTNILPSLKSEIMGRDGKLVIRPDSGDPVKIVCGDPEAPVGSPEWYGSVRLLDQIFGHTTTKNGYYTLDSHIGLIYGEQITRDRQEEILGRLKAAGYSSDNIVMGIGSFNYQYVTRDTHGMAMKATNGITTSRGSTPIQKKPKTDSGLKNSAKGYLRVVRDHCSAELKLEQNVSFEESLTGELKQVFLNGELVNPTTLSTIRAVAESELFL